jgi:hypothetical protein
MDFEEQRPALHIGLRHMVAGGGYWTSLGDGRRKKVGLGEQRPATFIWASTSIGRRDNMGCVTHWPAQVARSRQLMAGATRLGPELQWPVVRTCVRQGLILALYQLSYLPAIGRAGLDPATIRSIR